MNQAPRLAAILTGLAMSNVPAPALAIVTSDEAGSHVVTPGEPMFGVNLDGVAAVGFPAGFSPFVDEFSPYCSGALIADRYVLSAAHCFDIDEDGRVDEDLFFDPMFSVQVAFDLPGERVVIPITQARIVKDWRESFADIAIVELDQDAPATLPRYTLYGSADEVGQDFVRAGYGLPGHGAVPQTSETIDQAGLAEIGGVKRAGRNRFEALGEQLDNTGGQIDDFLPDIIPAGSLLASDFDSSLPEHNALAELGFDSDLGFGDDEVQSYFRDSGGPVFIGSTIAGVMSMGITSPLSPQDVEFREGMWAALALDARVSSFQEFILAATDGQAQFVFNLPGDYNGNGAVEQADLDLVLLNWGSDAAEVPDTWISDLPTGMIDEQELDAVLMNWGNSAGAALTSNNVPEPSTALMATIAMASLLTATTRHMLVLKHRSTEQAQVVPHRMNKTLILPINVLSFSSALSATPRFNSPPT